MSASAHKNSFGGVFMAQLDDQPARTMGLHIVFLEVIIVMNESFTQKLQFAVVNACNDQLVNELINKVLEIILLSLLVLNRSKSLLAPVTSLSAN